MLHQLDSEKLGPHGEAMAAAVTACVHCGFCLPTCPTYRELGQEMDSPRGRIVLMKEVLEGSFGSSDVARYIDRCLGCLGCTTACPSGVRYGDLITSFRALAEPTRKRPLGNRLLRWLVLRTLPSPVRFRRAARLGRLARPLARILPYPLAAMLQLLPDPLPAARPLPEIYPAAGRRRARVALLAGCAQQVLSPDINWSTLHVLARNGVEVVVPREQGCCGALAAHTGEALRARAAARHNLKVFPHDVDAIVTNAAGCGSGLREYPLWLKGEPEEQAARQLADLAIDVCQFLVDLGAVTPPRLAQPMRVAYHDACHLRHAQGVTSAPRTLLQQIPNLELLEVPDGDICCGSAGTYAIEQPQTAWQLGQSKARILLATGADAVAMGNIGCMTQLQMHLRQLKSHLPILHTLQLLDRAYLHQS
jgi:glycolate oxidase iron-sulfur subunit